MGHLDDVRRTCPPHPTRTRHPASRIHRRQVRRQQAADRSPRAGQPGALHRGLRRGFEAGDVVTEPGQAGWQKALPQADSVSGMLEHCCVRGQGWPGCLEEGSARVVRDRICVGRLQPDSNRRGASPGQGDQVVAGGEPTAGRVWVVVGAELGAKVAAPSRSRPNTGRDATWSPSPRTSRRLRGLSRPMNLGRSSREMCA